MQKGTSFNLEAVKAKIEAARSAMGKWHAKAAESFIEFPPMQKGASFNLQALKRSSIRKWRLMLRSRTQPEMVIG
jgi:hypothetical protein